MSFPDSSPRWRAWHWWVKRRPALTLTSITAVVLGGTALSGCVGGVAGSILGAFILGLISNVIFFAQLPFEWQGLVQGLIILLALAGGVVMARGRQG